MATSQRPRRASSSRARRFYEKALTEAERDDLPSALEINGIDEEIGVLRVRIKTALAEHPEDLKLMFRGLDLLTRMVVRRYGLSPADSEGLTRELGDLRRQIGDLLTGQEAASA